MEPLFRAAIELGSSSAAILVLSPEGDLVLDEHRHFKSADGRTSLIGPARIEELSDGLSELIELARLHQVPVWRIKSAANHSFSSSFNAGNILKKIQNTLSLSVQLPRSEEEAQLLRLGATCGFELNTTTGIIRICEHDILATLFNGDSCIEQSTYRVGPKGLCDDLFGEAPERYPPAKVAKMRLLCERKLSNFQFSTRPRQLIVTGLEASALASMDKALVHPSPIDVHGHKLSRATLRSISDRLLSSSRSKRRALCPAYPTLVDSTYIAAFLLEMLCTQAQRDSFIVSSGDLRLGLLMHYPEDVDPQ